MQRALRIGLLVLALILLGGAVAWLALPAIAAVTPTTPTTPRAGRPVTFEQLVLAGCAVASMLTWVWLLAAVASVLVDTRVPVRCPRPLRVLVLAVVGVSAVAVPAHAAPAPVSDPGDARPGLTGLPLPDRPVTTVPTSAPERIATSPDRTVPSPRVRVTPGDSLWSIAAERLPPGSSQGDIDRAWREIARLNRAELSDGPHHLVPGQQLRIPDALIPSGKDS